MSVAASPLGQKIDITASVRAAYIVVIDNARLLVVLAWLPFAILVGFEIIAWLLSGGRFGEILASLIRFAGFVVFGTAFIVRWHRFILLGETTAVTLFPPGWGAYVLTGVKLGLLLLIGIILLVVIAIVVPHSLTQVIAIVGGIALLLVLAGVSLAFPAAAIKRPISLVGDAWDLVTGNYWRLVACLIACCAPFGIISYIVNEISDAMPSFLWIAFQIISLAVWFASSAVVASLLSDIYRRLAPTEVEGTPA
jgi:hypothetical protein